MELNLEKELMENLRELTEMEQDAIKVFYAIYVNCYGNLKREKIESLDRSIAGQIKFYGKKKEDYTTAINSILEKYAGLIEQIISLYNLWLCAIIKDLQEVYNNQKIAIANHKISIDAKDKLKRMASEQKINNYEIVIQECKRQLEECKSSMKNKINELFCNKDRQLSIEKSNIWQRFKNIFTGKTKVQEFVINALQVELQSLENQVKMESEKIHTDVIHKIATIEDAIMQTQQNFKKMLEE